MNEFDLGNLQHIKEAYNQDGYVIVRNVLDTDLVKEINQHIDWLIKRHPDLRPERLGHWLVAKDPFWFRFVSDPNLLKVATSLIGSNIAFFAADYIAKPPKYGQAVAWHQDGNYWGLEPMDVITIWFAVTSSTIKNGCVNVIPGTQKLGLLPHRPKTDTINLLNSEVDPSMVDEGKSISIELRAGDISVHHPFVLHGSSTNTSNQWRRGGSIQYMPVTTRIISKNWPCAFLLQGEDVDGTNEYQPIPKYIANQHMSFLGCESF